MMSMRRYTGVLSIGLLGLTAVSACSSNSTTKPSSSGFFAESLAQMPASVRGDDGRIELNAADLDAATKLSGIDRPADGTTGDDLSTWLLGISGGQNDRPVSVVLPRAVNPTNVTNAAAFDSEVGWSVSDVHSYIEFQLPPDVFSVMTGSFSDDALTAAVGEPTNGIWSIGGGDHEVDVDEISDARPLGEALRFAHSDDRLAVARATPIVEDWLQEAGKESSTLAGDEPLMSVAEALDDAGAYAALLFEEDFSLRGGQLTPDQAAQIEDVAGTPSTGSFTALGAGLSVRDGDPMGIIVYVYPDADSAESGADGVRTLLADGTSFITNRPWNELFSAPQVTVDGSVVVATFGFADFGPSSLWRMVESRDSLVTSAAG